MARRPITASERMEWTALGHLIVLQCLSDAADWSASEFAFHGGTSLHLSWNSPRFSEDLDFLLASHKKDRLNAVMTATLARVRRVFVRLDPDINVEIKDKSTDRMGHYQFALSKKDVLGSVMIKAEFWHVEPAYLQSYQNTPKTPSVPLDLGGKNLRIDCMVPAATLQSAFCDKLVAFSTRPFLKWRDLFDFWWIQQQTQFEPLPDAELGMRLRHHLSAYKTVDGIPVGEALRRFAALLEDPAIVEAAQTDLKKFLPKKLWDMFWPDRVVEMIATAKQGALKAAAVAEATEAAEVAQVMRSSVAADDGTAGGDGDGEGESVQRTERETGG